jgi:hypothetical protein
VLYHWRSLNAKGAFKGSSDAFMVLRLTCALEGPQNAISHGIIVL